MNHQETIDYFLKVVWQTVANRYNQLASEFGITQSIGYLLINIDEHEGTTVSQVAALLVHLASDAGEQITGAAIPVYWRQV